MRFLFIFFLLLGCVQAAQPTTPVFNSVGVMGSSTGKTTIQSANSGATNYTFNLPLANSTPLFFSVAPTNGQCPQFSGTTGLVISVACGGGGGSGTVTSFSIVNANGLNGSVGTATTTPALTLFPTFNGIAKASAGGAFSAATAGTDYLVTNQTITLSSDCTGSGSTAISITCTKTSGVAFGTLATLNAAPAGTLTGTTLNATITTAAGLGGTSGHIFGYLDGANTISGLQTYTNSNFAMLGSSTGKTTIASLNSSATNYTMSLNAASGTIPYLPSGVTPVNGDCAVWFGTTGGLTDIGTCPGTITVNDGLSNTKPGTNNLTLLGGVLTGTAPNATFTPQSTNRIVTAGGTAPIVSTDAGNVVIYNNSGLTSALAALSSSYLPAGQSVTICNEFAGTLSGTSVNAIVGYPTGGTAGAYTFTVAAPQNGVMTCIGFLSDGTTLYANFALPPAIAFLTTADQVLTGGFIPTAFSNGTASSGTKTIDCGANPIQTVTNGGAFTLAMATNDGTCTLRVTNNGSAGAITFSGFSVGSNTGDALTTTNTSKFDIELTRVGGNPRYFIHALQAGSTTFALVGTPVQWSAAATGTSGAYNTTGAQIIAVGASYNGTSGFVPVLTDSLSNTWVGPTTAYNGAIRSLFWYCVSCSTGAAQTFTLTTSGGNSFFEAGVEAFSAPVSYAIDGALVTNAAGNAPTVNPGSKTPAGAGDLFISVLASSDTGAAITVGNSFTPQPATVASPGGGFLGFGMAYLVNAGSSAQNPTWTITAGTNGASAIQAAFVP